MSGALSAAASAEAATFTVTNRNDSGAGSLRQAILDANAVTSEDLIRFAIPGRGVKRIEPLTPLPPLTDAVRIDGYTQPRTGPNTSRRATNAILKIVLSGENLLAGAGLRLAAEDCEIHGLVIQRFPGPQIEVEADGVLSTIRGNFIGTNAAGTDPAGSALPPSSVGIRVAGSVSIGTRGRNTYGRNLISGNGGHGVLVVAGGFAGLHGNLIGLGRTGRTPLGNAQSGIRVEGGSADIGPERFSIGDVLGNVISSNDGAGISIENAGMSILDNRVGTDAGGQRDRGNDGGGIVADASFGEVRGNLVSGNGGHGVAVTNADRGEGSVGAVELSGNNVGTDRAAREAIPNDGTGIRIADSASNIHVGFPRHGRPSGSNVISGNHRNGVTVIDSPRTQVKGNFIGTDGTGEATLPNDGTGVEVVGQATFRGSNLISGNRGSGIVLKGSDGASIEETTVGVSVSRRRALPNRHGIVLVNSRNNVIGNDRLYVAHNRLQGIKLDGSFNDVRNARIRGNGRDGVVVPPGAGIGNEIRLNRIWGNGGLGIDISDPGPTPNDTRDPDVGPNERQNSPIIASARYRDGKTRVRGRLNSMPNQEFVIDVYRSPGSRGASEGRRRVGSDRITTDADGLATFRVVVNGRWSGQWLRATATRTPPGDTSEFGPAEPAP